MLIDTQTLQKSNECIKPIAMPLDIDNQELSQLLIDVALNRDKQAFTVLFKFFAPKIKRIASNRFPNADQANVVVQETMSNVWCKAHLFNFDKGLATTWVYTIMRNVTFDMLRKVQSSKEDTLSDDIWPLAEKVFVEDDIFEDHLARNNVMDSINTLSDNHQQVVKGFYFLELSQEQLAQHLNVPLGTIKSRLRLALAKLRQQIGEDND